MDLFAEVKGNSTDSLSHSENISCLAWPGLIRNYYKKETKDPFKTNFLCLHWGCWNYLSWGPCFKTEFSSSQSSISYWNTCQTFKSQTRHTEGRNKKKLCLNASQLLLLFSVQNPTKSSLLEPKWIFEYGCNPLRNKWLLQTWDSIPQTMLVYSI